MKHETAGDPMTGLKWTRKTTEKIAGELSSLDIHVSANTVGRLLKQMDFSLRVNHKKLSTGSKESRRAKRTVRLHFQVKGKILARRASSCERGYQEERVGG